MTEISYTLLAEGIAEYCGIPLLLEKIGGDNFDFKIDNKSPTNPSKSKVEKYFKQYLIFSGDLFIAGIDLDQQDTEMTAFYSKKKNMLKSMSKADKEKTIIFIPIQTFDYWLLYQKSNANRNSLESKKPEDIKRQLYGDKKAKAPTITKITEGTISNKFFDIHELCKQSGSFNEFYSDIREFLNKYY